ncbi:hypothetical protein FB451DRAFT_1173503 [Mycena latifolia]|nr:hypothetical protein FB451DRAFT_1173503 [Mycena latifolia]
MVVDPQVGLKNAGINPLSNGDLAATVTSQVNPEPQQRGQRERLKVVESRIMTVKQMATRYPRGAVVSTPLQKRSWARGPVKALHDAQRRVGQESESLEAPPRQSDAQHERRTGIRAATRRGKTNSLILHWRIMKIMTWRIQRRAGTSDAGGGDKRCLHSLPSEGEWYQSGCRGPHGKACLRGEGAGALGQRCGMDTNELGASSWPREVTRNTSLGERGTAHWRVSENVPPVLRKRLPRAGDTTREAYQMVPTFLAAATHRCERRKSK